MAEVGGRGGRRPDPGVAAGDGHDLAPADVVGLVGVGELDGVHGVGRPRYRRAEQHGQMQGVEPGLPGGQDELGPAGRQGHHRAVQSDLEMGGEVGGPSLGEPDRIELRCSALLKRRDLGLVEDVVDAQRAGADLQPGVAVHGEVPERMGAGGRGTGDHQRDERPERPEQREQSCLGAPPPGDEVHE